MSKVCLTNYASPNLMTAQQEGLHIGEKPKVCSTTGRRCLIHKAELAGGASGLLYVPTPTNGTGEGNGTV